MNEESEATTETVDAGNSVGIITGLGELPPGTILDEGAVARIFSRHTASVKRAVERGELPPPVRMFGRPCWTAGSILVHIEARLEAAKEDAAKDAARIASHSP